MMLFVHTERESGWPLHLNVVSKMKHYILVAVHPNYALYSLCYLHVMKTLPTPMLNKFMQEVIQEEHAARYH